MEPKPRSKNRHKKKRIFLKIYIVQDCQKKKKEFAQHFSNMITFSIFLFSHLPVLTVYPFFFHHSSLQVLTFGPSACTFSP